MRNAVQPWMDHTDMRNYRFRAFPTNFSTLHFISLPSLPPSFHSLIPHSFAILTIAVVHSPHREETSTDIATSAITVYNPHVCLSVGRPPMHWREGEGPTDLWHQKMTR